MPSGEGLLNPGKQGTDFVLHVMGKGFARIFCQNFAGHTLKWWICWQWRPDWKWQLD